MELFAKSSNYITKLVTQFENNMISKDNFNKNILVTTIFTHFYLKKEKVKNLKIKEMQNKTFQSFYKLEEKQAESERKLISKIKDRVSKKIVEESIKNERQKILDKLASKKDVKRCVEQTYNYYISPNRISLSLKFQMNETNNNNKKYIPKSNVEIKYLNPNLNEKEERILTDNFIESPLYQDYNLDEINLEENESDSEKNNKTKEQSEIEEFTNMIENEADEFLFYDEKKGKKERQTDWMNKFTQDDIIYDFLEFKQKKKRLIGPNNGLLLTLQQDKIIKKEHELFLKNSAAQYEQISQQEHYHEFTEYLSEKSYKSYIKKMNYSYLILMLLSFFDYEKFSNSCYDVLDEKQSLVIFIKRMILSAGLSYVKIYESIMSTVLSKKELQFEDYLSCFLPIFNLSEKIW